MTPRSRHIPMRRARLSILWRVRSRLIVAFRRRRSTWQHKNSSQISKNDDDMKHREITQHSSMLFQCLQCRFLGHARGWLAAHTGVASRSLPAVAWAAHLERLSPILIHRRIPSAVLVSACCGPAQHRINVRRILTSITSISETCTLYASVYANNGAIPSRRAESII